MRPFILGILAAIVAIFLALLFVPVPVFAGQACIGLDYRPGGLVKWHVDTGNAWARRGECIVIKNWQESAAAIQVAVFVENGGRACYIKPSFFTNPGLRFHKAESIDRRTGKASYDDSLKRYAPRVAAKVKKATGKELPIYGMLDVRPSQIGIPQCPKKVAVKRWLGAMPIQIYRLR